MWSKYVGGMNNNKTKSLGSSYSETVNLVCFQLFGVASKKLNTFALLTYMSDDTFFAASILNYSNKPLVM